MRKCIFSICPHYSHKQFITLEVTISRARLDKGITTQPKQDGDMKGQKPFVLSMRFMAEGDVGITDRRTQDASREEVCPSLLIIRENCWEGSHETSSLINNTRHC